MNELAEYLESGILEMYVAGSLNAEEMYGVEQMCAKHPELLAELEAIQDVMARLWLEGDTPKPKAELKDKVLAKIKGIQDAPFDPERPPVLNALSVAADYAYWVGLEGIAPPEHFEDLFFIPVANNADGLTAVVWINGHVEEEVHDVVVEKFLVLEGECKIDIEGEVHYLKPGDYLSIPVYKKHFVDVLSEGACKLIVQRVA